MGVLAAVSNTATMFSGGVPDWMAWEGPRMMGLEIRPKSPLH